ncbi:LysR family transcriptional regulator [Leptolyngbya sp. 'hensonii']|uniref:LysR family transcriptional regulator n=1 Tax=Leptolyngbya sp. 'hensonii' TaxID=1922337 RepID=UPI0009501F34|nr:LysR family transcriptional regulator [Leptolyngbya sp. 'hensonii']OLP15533.1 LysR family transcriptional regulator [Leptolyngbya sp. 'hensonii']
MELRHLRYFIILAEELHFGRAAERLHIAQPPLSQQIRQLEVELGFQLFYRTKRKVQLTEAGQLFLGRCQDILQQLEQAIQLGQQAHRGEAGHLRVGFVGSAAYNVLPPILRAFRSQTPTVTLELQELTTDQQLRWLQEGRIDIGFVRPPVKGSTIHSTVIFQESLIVALPESHILTTQTHVATKSLFQESFILFPRSLAPGLYDPIISLCRQAGFSPQIAQEAIQMQTIVSLVAAEMGVAIVPASLQNLQRQGVVYKTLQEETPTVELALIWRVHPSPTVQRFLEIAGSNWQPDPVNQDCQQG